MSAAKPLVWCRFEVTISTATPAEVYAKIIEGLPTDGAFKRRGAGFDTSVRFVVEYTARGSNGNDVLKRVARLGIDRSQIAVKKIAMFDVESRPNQDLADVVRLSAPEVVVIEVDSG